MVNTLARKRIIVGITGGIAAYKSADLVRRLRERDAEVRVVMTPAAQEFIGALTLQALSGQPVHVSLLDPAAESGMGHIELARWADRLLVAPATADFMAKLSYGLADDLLSTVCLASSAPIVVAPAMNQQMWAAAATQANCATLATRGIQLLGPAAGDQACGEVGPGRMLEPLELVSALAATFAPGTLSDVRVLVTAGPTREPLDPVRYISNRSSGRMGYGGGARRSRGRRGGDLGERPGEPRTTGYGATYPYHDGGGNVTCGHRYAYADGYLYCRGRGR